MAGTVLPGDLAIILGTLVGVLDQHGDRRAGGRHRLAVGIEHDAGQHLHQIVLAPLRDEAGLSGLALVEPDLQLGKRKAQARRAAVHDAAERRTMAFAPGGYAEEVTECIVRHVFPRWRARAGRRRPRHCLKRRDTHRPKNRRGKSLSLRQTGSCRNPVSVFCNLMAVTKPAATRFRPPRRRNRRRRAPARRRSPAACRSRGRATMRRAQPSPLLRPPSRHRVSGRCR